MANAHLEVFASISFDILLFPIEISSDCFDIGWLESKDIEQWRNQNS